MTHNNNWWKYTFFTLLLSIILFLSVQAIIFIAVKNTGEFLYGDALVREHQKRGGLYRTAITDETYSLGSKLARLEYFNDAKIIALGSSRVLLFEQDMFNQPFVNLGTSMNIVNLDYAKDKIIETSKPKFVLLGLDFWWLHPSNKKLADKQTESIWAMPLFNPPFSLGKLYISTKMVMTSFSRWLVRGDIDNILLTNFYPSFFNNKNKVFPNPLGLGALKYDSGVDLHGTYRYEWVFKGYKNSASKKHFKGTMKRIEEGISGFEYADHTIDPLWNRLLKIVKDFEKNDIEVIVFLPPVGETVAAKMKETGKYNILNDIASRAKRDGLNFYNFHNPAIINSGDCEFLDGFHGGEVTYRRILTKMSQDNPSSIGKYVKLDYLQKQIDHYAGRAVARDTKYKSNKIEEENDFLNIGCKKQSVHRFN